MTTDPRRIEAAKEHERVIYNERCWDGNGSPVEDEPATPPFPARNQAVKWPNLERNAYIGITACISVVTLAALKYLFFG